MRIRSVNKSPFREGHPICNWIAAAHQLLNGMIRYMAQIEQRYLSMLGFKTFRLGLTVQGGG